MQFLSTIFVGKFLAFSLMSIAIAGCVLVTDEMVNRKVTKSQEASLLVRQGLSSMKSAKVEQAVLQLLKASTRDGSADAIHASLATMHVELGDIEHARYYISKLKYHDGIPARAQKAYANSRVPSTRVNAAHELYELGVEILVHQKELLRIQDYDPYKNAAALFSQSYGAFWDAGQYNDALCALRLAYGLAPTTSKASYLFAHLVSLGRYQEALDLLEDASFKSNRELVGARDLKDALVSLVANTVSLTELNAASSSGAQSSLFGDVEADTIVRLRNLFEGKKAPADVDTNDMFVTPPSLL